MIHHVAPSSYEAYQTADGYVTIGATGPPGAFEEFCRAIGAPELAERPEYHDNASRVTHQETLREEVEERTRARPTAYWVEVFTQLGMPSGPILDIGESLESAQAASLGIVVDADHESIGSYQTLRHPLRIGSGMPETHGAPNISQHARQVLEELGRTEAEILEPSEQGAVLINDLGED